MTDKPTNEGDLTPDLRATDSVPSRDVSPQDVPTLQKPPFSDPTQVKAPAPKLVKHGTPSNPDATTAPESSERPKRAEPTPNPSRSGAERIQNRLSRAATAKADGVTPVAHPHPKTAGDFARETQKRGGANTAVFPAVEDDLKQAPIVEMPAGGARQARLKIVRVEPWSVAKVSFALSVALGIVAVVAVTILWLVLSFAGVWDQINSSVTTVLSDNSGTFDITEYLGFGRIVGLTIVLSALNTVVMTSIAVIGSHLYNLAVQLLGGVDVTLSEDN